MRISWLSTLIAISLTGLACSTKLPTHRWIDHNQAMRTITERDNRVHTVESRCRLLLRSGDGQSVQLSGVLLARVPSHLRLRAYKLSQPVLDITLTPNGLWLFAAGGANNHTEDAFSELTADRMTQAWALATAGMDDDDWFVDGEQDGSTLRLRKKLNDQDSVLIAEIDKSTLTVRRYRLEDGAGQERMHLSLERYRYFSPSNVVWPTRIVSRSAEGSFTLLLDDVEFNGDLVPIAFQPPKRAKKLP